ncbi:MAG: hemolysin III [Myxococcota bacterium]|jgi:hemolysin III
MNFSRFNPEVTGTPAMARPARSPAWWWSRLELSSNTHRSFAHVAPRSRGWLHLWMVFIWPVLVIRLIMIATPGEARFSALIFGLAMQAMFTASAVFHWKRWDPWTTEVLFRFDHTGIFLAIGGSMTPLALMALSGWKGAAVFVIAWGLTLVGASIALWPGETPVGFGNTAFIGGGLLILPFLPSAFGQIGAGGITLLLTGGATYVVGAVLLAFQRPRFSERWLGYHEVWHAMVVLGVLQHYVMYERYFLPLALTAA